MASPMPDNEAEVELKLRMVHELKMYMQDLFMRLYGNDTESLDHLGSWERVEARTSVPLERVWSRRKWSVTTTTACHSPEVTSATMFLGKYEGILQEHCRKRVKDVRNPAPVYMPAPGEVKGLHVDVEQDLF